MRVLMLVMAMILWGSVSTTLAEGHASMDVAGVGISGCPTGLAHIIESSSLLPLPAGAVKPKGWLKDWCETARDGYIGHLDEVDEHFRIAWTTNCIRRGKLLSWTNAHKGSWSAEGGAYWFDGLVRLAWQLDDPALKDAGLVCESGCRG